MKFWWKLQQWWYRKTTRGVIVIDTWGQATESPKVSVGVASRYGSQSVYTFKADQTGHARAKYYADGLAHVMNVRVIDRRKP